MALSQLARLKCNGHRPLPQQYQAANASVLSLFPFIHDVRFKTTRTTAAELDDKLRTAETTDGGTDLKAEGKAGDSGTLIAAGFPQPDHLCLPAHKNALLAQLPSLSGFDLANACSWTNICMT